MTTRLPTDFSALVWSPHYSWLPGTLLDDGRRGKQFAFVRGQWQCFDGKWQPVGEARPVLSDPATIGNLLALVRKAFNDPNLVTSPDGVTWAVFLYDTATDTTNMIAEEYGEGEALAAALLVAPAPAAQVLLEDLADASHCDPGWSYARVWGEDRYVWKVRGPEPFADVTCRDEEHAAAVCDRLNTLHACKPFLPPVLDPMLENTINLVLIWTEIPESFPVIYLVPGSEVPDWVATLHDAYINGDASREQVARIEALNDWISTNSEHWREDVEDPKNGTWAKYRQLTHVAIQGPVLVVCTGWIL